MIRIVIVDDHRLFRFGLRKLLAEASKIKIVGEAESGEQAIDMVRELRPSVVLMDLWMPGIGGIEATRRIEMMALDIKVIMLSACADAPFPLQSLKSGARGYISKGISGEELASAIRKVFVGKRYLSTDVAQNLAINAFEDGTNSPFEQLSGREMQIMMMVVNCHKVPEISSNLHLSPKTVNSYRYRIFEKLNVSSDVELVLMAVRYGMVTPALNGAAQAV